MGFKKFQRAIPNINDTLQLTMVRTGDDCLSMTAVLGNLDSFHVLQDGTDEELRAEMRAGRLS